MTSMTKARYLLKILAGPHQGAEVALDNEELVIGSALECDFILSDALVSPEHLKLVLADDRITLIPLSASVYVDGQEIPMESRDIEPFQFVTIGSTYFVIGPTEGEWPPLTSGDIPDLKKLEVPTEEGEENDDQEEKLEDDQTPKEEENPAPKPVSLLNIGLGIAGLFVLLALVLGGLYFLTSSPKPVRADPIDYAPRVNMILDRLGLEDSFKVTKREGGILLVEGWVETEKEKDEIVSQFDNIISRIDLRVWSQDQVISQTSDFFKTLKLPLGVEGVKPGVVKIMGYYGDTNAWSRVKEDLSVESPGIKSIVDEVLTSEEVQALSKEIFRKFELSDKVYLEPQASYLAAKGLITEDAIPKLRDAIKAIQDKIGFPISIQNQILVSNVEKVYLDAQIDSVVVGDQGVIITKDGQRLFEGGILSGGYVIMNIGREGITLKKGDQEITLKIGDSNER